MCVFFGPDFGLWSALCVFLWPALLCAVVCDTLWYLRELRHYEGSLEHITVVVGNRCAIKLDLELKHSAASVALRKCRVRPGRGLT